MQRRSDRSTATALPDPADPAAREVVSFWNQTFSRGDRESFERRLAWDRLTWEEAHRLAARSDGTESGVLPSWIEWLDRILAQTGGVSRDFTSGTLEESDPASWTNEPPFVELWVPPLRAARQILSARLSPPVPTHATASVRRAFEQQLVREISNCAESAVFECFQEWLRATLGSTGAEAADREAPAHHYESFIHEMLESGFVPLWLSYPVLARQVSLVAERWVESTAEFLQRLDADLAEIVAFFAAGADPGPLTSVEPALSDPHHGRRRVVGLAFESGLRVVYKPRHLGLDRAFNDLIRWMAANGLPAPPAPLRLLERDGYGWVQHAAHEPMRTRLHAKSYYRRSGSLLCLAHALRGRDLHMENVVATGDGPVLVDLEPLLQPVSRLHGSELNRTEAPSPEPEDRECLVTGLLSMFELGANGEVYDVGGLCGDGAGVLSLPRRVWRGLRTCALRFEEQTDFSAPVGNQVVVGGVVQRAEDYADEIRGGFTDAYRWMLSHGDRLTQADGPLAAFAHCRTRVIPRPTNQYAMLASVLAAPRYQRDGAHRSAALDVLLRPFNRSGSRPRIWPALLEERRALESLDVPIFWVPCDSTDVHSGDLTIVADHFAEAGLTAVRARIQQLSESDLRRQQHLVARSLTESPRSRFESPAVGVPEVFGDSAQRHDVFVETAIWIGTELRLRAGREENGTSWASAAGDDLTPTSCPHVLYNGTVGPALFYSALYQVTHDSQWADAARALIEPMIRALTWDALMRWAADGIGVGDGLGSIVYGLTWIGRLLGDDVPLEAASTVAAVLAERIEGDGSSDLLGGTAGAVLGLLALYSVRSDDQLLAWASAGADQLLARQEMVGHGSSWPEPDGRRLVGFAHGAAGIAYALHRLFRVTGNATIGDAAARGFQFVRLQYLGSERNWPITDPASEPSVAVTPMTAWCHGAPGVVMASVLSLDGQTLGAVTDQTEGALATTAQWMPGRPDHLCCGTLGRSDVLLTVGHYLDRPDLVSAAVDLADRVAQRAIRTGHFRLSAPGFEYRVFDPGFFRGLSGIGYELLRLTTPTRLPSVLAFEAP